MAQLLHATDNKVLISELKVATKFVDRLVGLIGKKSIQEQEGMLFPRSNWIHTFFMSIPIDVIYLDKQNKITKLETLTPGRLAAPVFSARSVVEVKAGFIEKSRLTVGDQLNVGN